MAACLMRSCARWSRLVAFRPDPSATPADQSLATSRDKCRVPAGLGLRACAVAFPVYPRIPVVRVCHDGTMRHYGYSPSSVPAYSLFYIYGKIMTDIPYDVSARRAVRSLSSRGRVRHRVVGQQRLSAIPTLAIPTLGELVPTRPYSGELVPGRVSTPEIGQDQTSWHKIAPVERMWRLGNPTPTCYSVYP